MRSIHRLSLVAAAAAWGCGVHASNWGQTPALQPPTFGLASSVAIVDDPTHRVVTLRAHADQRLDVAAYPIGHHALSSVASPDLARLFVLSAGDAPRRSDADQYPSLTVLDTSGAAPAATSYPMSEPLGNLAIDPLGRYVAAFASASDSTSFVENPNEIVLFDITAPPGPGNPTARTIRSFGGRPQRLTFTQTLQLPAGPRRLLVVETDQDVTILDLDHAMDSPPRSEITVRLTSGGDARQLVPAGIAVDDGDPNRTDDARIAVRTTNDTSVITMQLAPAAPGQPNDFFPQVNLTDVGGIPSDVGFVRTDGGLRVSALVPSSQSAVLVDPDTSVTSAVALPAPYAHLSLVTGVVQQNGASNADVALLWDAQASSAGVALWTLGETAGAPYRSVEVLGLADTVTGVLDVPQPNAQLKLLQTGTQNGFYVLDLHSRTAAPLSTFGSSSLAVSPDGARLWAFQQGTSKLSELDFGTLRPVPLYSDRAIASVYDVARDDGGRALVAIHDTGTVGATVFDALAPDTATSRLYSGLLLEGLQP
jgi:hypothetical protein